MPPPEPLAGRRILLTRSPGRASALADALEGAGAAVRILPLIDFERAHDQAALNAAFDRLSAGAYDWLVVTSATTFLALEDKAAARGITLAEALPASTRVAAVGPSTAEAAEAAGIAVSFLPRDRSAAGIAEEWPAGERSVLLPQADIADGGLAEALAAKGSSVDTVIAYHTVDYPAQEPLRAGREPASGTKGRPLGRVPLGRPVLEASQAAAELEAGLIDAVVAASPSAARRIAALLPDLGNCRFVAIGPTTATAAADVGVRVTATANQPTPAGIVAALVTLFATEGN